MKPYEHKQKLRTMFVKKVGIFDLDGLYKVMQRWFYDNGYYFEEPTYKHKPGTAAGKEEEIWWVCIECCNVHYGKQPPEKCPSCDHSKSDYQVK